MPVRMLEGIPKTTFFTLSLGVNDQVCRCASTKEKKNGSKKGSVGSPKKPDCCFLSRYPPSMIRSAPFQRLLVKPAVMLASCLLAKSSGELVPLRSVAIWLSPIDGSTV